MDWNGSGPNAPLDLPMMLFFEKPSHDIKGFNHQSFLHPQDVFSEFSKFSEKTFAIIVERLEPATSCVRDEDTTKVPPRHMSETGSLN